MRFGRFEEPSSGHTLAQGDMLYYDLGLGGWNIVPVGTNDQVLKVDGAATTAIKDSGATGHVCTLVGTAALSTTQKKLGNGGLYLDGDSDYITIPDNADWNFGSGDFTIDFWIKMAAMGTQYTYVSQWITDDVTQRWEFGIDSSQHLYFYARNGSELANYGEDSVSLNATAFHHIALVRNGTTLTPYVDGVAQAWTAVTAIGSSSLPDLAAPLIIGKRDYSSGPSYTNGYIDEFRVSKGIARWTADFTPPTTAYTSDSYTKLLLHCDLVPVWRT